MKTFSDRQSGSHSAGTGLGLALVSAALVFAGCGQGGQATAGAQTPAPDSLKQAQTDHRPDYAATPMAAPVQATAPDGGPDLAVLNRSLLRWILQNRRKPASFADFAATAGVVIPPAPAGQKYIIAKNMHIQLVSQ